MVVIVDKAELSRFKRRVLKRCPKEFIEGLLGVVQGSQIRIGLFMSIPHEATRRSVYLDPEYKDQLIDEAHELGMHFIGTIHSHPNTRDRSLSELDHVGGFNGGEIISGIAAIEHVNNRRLVRVAFWVPQEPLPVRFYAELH